jgi:hypothetical protein
MKSNEKPGTFPSCVNVLLQFNLNSVVLNQLHVILLHILNLVR